MEALGAEVWEENLYILYFYRPLEKSGWHYIEGSTLLDIGAIITMTKTASIY